MKRSGSAAKGSFGDKGVRRWSCCCTLCVLAGQLNRCTASTIRQLPTAARFLLPMLLSDTVQSDALLQHITSSPRTHRPLLCSPGEIDFAVKQSTAQLNCSAANLSHVQSCFKCGKAPLHRSLVELVHQT